MKEPDQRFLWALCKMRGKYPDDPEFEDMNPVMRAWMFFSYMQDREDEHTTLENQGYLIGSFTNPELVRKMLGKDGAQTVSTSDEDFERTLEMIRQSGGTEESNLTKRKRKRKIKE